MLLTASLDFDEVQRVGHDDIHVHARVLVFGVVQINEDFAIYDTYADGSDSGFDGQGVGFALSNKPGGGELDGDRGPCDGSGACASVGLQDIAIDPEGAGAEFIEIDNGAEGAPDEALDFGATPIHAASGRVALLPGESGVGEHGILRGDPPTGFILFFHPARHGLLNSSGADDFCFPKTHKDRSLGVWGDAFFDGDGADLKGLAVVGAGHTGTNLLPIEPARQGNSLETALDGAVGHS